MSLAAPDGRHQFKLQTGLESGEKYFTFLAAPWEKLWRNEINSDSYFKHVWWRSEPTFVEFSHFFPNAGFVYFFLRKSSSFLFPPSLKVQHNKNNHQWSLAWAFRKTVGFRSKLFIVEENNSAWYSDGLVTSQRSDPHIDYRFSARGDVSIFPGCSCILFVPSVVLDFPKLCTLALSYFPHPSHHETGAPRKICWEYIQPEDINLTSQNLSFTTGK